MAICQPLLFHVTALPSSSKGTTCGSRAERGTAKGASDAGQQETEEDPLGRALPEGQRGQAERGQRRGTLRELEEAFAAVMVGGLARRQRQQEDGKELDQPRQAEIGGGTGALVQFPADGYGLNLGADAGQNAAGQ